MQLRAGGAERRKLLCTAGSGFAALSTKTEFQENGSVLFVFSDTLLVSCEL